MIFKELEKLNFNEKEAKVYLALLELGEANIQQISKKSGIKRTTIYDIIETLKKRGLLSIITKNKKSLYFAEDPRQLEKRLEEEKERLKKIMPELLAITNLIDKKPQIRFFEGEAGIKEVYRDTLDYPNQELIAWVTEETKQLSDLDFLNNYVKERIKKKIWVRAIGPDNETMNNYKTLDEKSLRKTKLISTKQFPLQVEINLYGKNKIGIMSFSEKIGLIIESTKIHNTLKSIFELNWNSL